MENLINSGSAELNNTDTILDLFGVVVNSRELGKPAILRKVNISKGLVYLDLIVGYDRPAAKVLEVQGQEMKILDPQESKFIFQPKVSICNDKVGQSYALTTPMVYDLEFGALYENYDMSTQHQIGKRDGLGDDSDDYYYQSVIPRDSLPVNHVYSFTLVRLIKALVSHQVSGEDILKGLRLDMNQGTLTGAKLIENHLGGWNFIHEGKYTDLSKLLNLVVSEEI